MLPVGDCCEGEGVQEELQVRLPSSPDITASRPWETSAVSPDSRRPFPPSSAAQYSGPKRGETPSFFPTVAYSPKHVISIIETEDQMALVSGRELAHVINRHASPRVRIQTLPAELEARVWETWWKFVSPGILIQETAGVCLGAQDVFARLGLIAATRRLRDGGDCGRPFPASSCSD